MCDHPEVFNHAPRGYDCPFCRTDPRLADHPLEILHRYDQVTVRMNPKWWPRNPGSALVIPNDHYENVYDLPPDLGAPIQHAVHDTALALKEAFSCAGVSTRQHNEPAGNQDVWHYHVHVFPRYQDDRLYESQGEWAGPNDMRVLAERIRCAWPQAYGPMAR